MTLTDLFKFVAFIIIFHLACFAIGYSLGFYPH